ncbi:hypothetical protein VNO78_27453 [Psophocarpus tetragonolobus]|uniref:Uncharacterized protein n=1 Tax=Psophocarpus tetragonolobus TaxID=3891 RepID=A0AAN9S1M9_PSOTE
MSAENIGDFSVTVTNEEVVAALLPMQAHSLPLSNLDLLLPALDVGVFFCYKNPMANSTNNKLTFGSMVGTLKKALAQTLISYYVLAGEVVLYNMGEPEMLCNNRGVDFVEAVADVELKCLNFYNPDDSIEGKFVPKKNNGVLAVQTTLLKCNGIVVACTFDHRITDAYSTNMFLTSWAEIAHLTKPTTTPCFCRSLVSTNGTSVIPHSLNDMYVPISKLVPPKTTTTLFLSRIYYVTTKQLNNMQLQSFINGTKRTKLECFSAFLWKIVACAASKGNKKGTKIMAKMGIVVDGRKRLCKGDKKKEEIMRSYFGNVLSIPFGGKLVEELMEKPLGFVADAVHEFLEDAMTKEHFLGLIDWVESHQPKLGVSRIYCGDNNSNEKGPSFVVSSGQRILEDKMDFGWGKFVFASYHFPWGGEAGYVMPMPSPLGNGDWVVYMHLTKEQLEIIESEATDVFRPITLDYINNSQSPAVPSHAEKPHDRCFLYARLTTTVHVSSIHCAKERGRETQTPNGGRDGVNFLTPIGDWGRGIRRVNLPPPYLIAILSKSDKLLKEVKAIDDLGFLIIGEGE